ncbi:MAG: PQQ-binding-like beta-propeller repeat protein [Candidatus Bathyarchaeia archaeon]
MQKAIIKLSAVATTLTLTWLMLTASMCAVTAQPIIELTTNLFLSVAPNPVGVGQTLSIAVQMDKTSPTAAGVVTGEFFTGYTVEITKPDGSKETQGPFKAWSTSGFFFTYTPTMEGKYTFQAIFPGQWINTTTFAQTGFGYRTNTSYYFRPSKSQIVEITVQTERIQPLPDIPLPTEYWTRPIYAENKGWWKMADNWLMQCYNTPIRDFCVTTAFAPYTSAPQSPHILWTKQIIFGGIAGGSFEDKKYYTGLAYEQYYLPLILEGRIIYVDHPPTSSADIFGTYCIDLYTGKEIWFIANESINFAQIYAIENPNEHGLIAHLWAVSGAVTNTTAKIYDAFTGRFLFTITNITWAGLTRFRAGSTIFGENGEILSYYLDNTRRSLLLWNSSLAIHRAFPWTGGEVGNIYSPRVGAVVDGRLGIQWNVSVPALPGNPSITVVGEGYLLAQDRVGVSTAGQYKSQFITIDAAFDAKTGQLLWTQNRTDLYSAYFRPPMVIGEGKYVLFDEAELRLHCFDIKTGSRVWVSDPMPSAWDIFTYQVHIAYGKVYTTSYSGHVYAYDLNTGKIAWDFYMGNAGVETVYGSWPTYNGFTIADGKIYVANDEHSPDSVAWRGGKLWCINATSGELIWSLSGWLRNPAISDGILTALNYLDGKVYTIGKGPTAVTVDALPAVATHGGKVLVKGMVTDISPGTKEYAVAARFPNGVPVVADESMSAWMEYVYMQKPKPTDVKGVKVTVTVLDPNGNCYDVATATTDSSGFFSAAFEPPVPGKYTVIATFAGSESYYGSSAETAIYVEEAPAPAAPEATPAPQAPVETYFAVSTIAIIVAIAVAVIILVRKNQ